jgi:hypothetical protein
MKRFGLIAWIFAWAFVGGLAGLAFCASMIAGLEPITDHYSVLRNGVALGDFSLVFGFPIAFVVWPFVPVDSTMSDAIYQHNSILGFTVAITLNWAWWSAGLGWVIQLVALKRRHDRYMSRPSA